MELGGLLDLSRYRDRLAARPISAVPGHPRIIHSVRSDVLDYQLSCGPVLRQGGRNDDYALRAHEGS
jgi:hypothetical protein